MNIKITKKKLIIIARILNFVIGAIILLYLGFSLKRQNYIIGDSAVEYGVSMHYDFKIMSASEDAFYNFDGMTREGKSVKFKIPKIWDLGGVYSLGDSIYKESGDSVLHLVKSRKRLDFPMKNKEAISFFFH